jgi:hypothetical protein
MAPIFSGETVRESEAPAATGSTNVGTYDSTLSCNDGTILIADTGTAGTFVVPSPPIDVVCRFTNARAQTSLIVQKAWDNGAKGDSADLTIGGGNPNVFETATSTATGAVGLETGTTHVATATVFTGQTITLGESLTSLSGATYASALACDNGVTLSPNTGTSGSFDVPADVAGTTITCTFTNTAPAPQPTVTKTVTSDIENPDGTWTTDYAVSVTNADQVRSTSFTLTDTLAFGADITVNSATVTGPAPPETGPAPSPSWNGITDTIVVAGGVIAPNTTLHYTVTVNSTVQAGAGTCADQGGFLNHAAVALSPAGAVLQAFTTPAPSPDPAAVDQEASACADPASPTVTKSVVSVAPGPSPGQWVVTYAVTVANGSTSQESYSLADPLGFPAGVTVTSTSASRVTSALNGSGASAPQTIPGWTGTGSGTTLATNQPLAASSKDTYTLVVGATVTSSVAAGALACSAAGPGHGYFNSATMTSGEDQFGAQACADITPPPPASTSPPATLASTGLTGVLPFTGLILSHYHLVAALLLGAGTTLVVASRRRRRRRRRKVRHAVHKA